MAEITWRPFDYDDKKNTAPPANMLVWVVDEYHGPGVSIGFFDGYTMRAWWGSDDCSVISWAPIEYPTAPAREEVDG